MKPSHPYYPRDVDIPGYAANEWHFTTLLAVFGSGCVSILSTALVVTTRKRPDLPSTEILTVLWFVLCELCNSLAVSIVDLIDIDGVAGCLHTIFECTSVSSSRLQHADNASLLRTQLQLHRWWPAPLLTAMEGVCLLRLPLPDAGPLCARC